MDGEPHSVVSLMHERHAMMRIFLADSHREWERHLLNRQQISNLARLQEEIEAQLNKQEQKLQEAHEKLERKLAEIESEKQKLRERYGQSEQEEDGSEQGPSRSNPRHLQEENLFRQTEEDYILEERHQHEQIDLVKNYLKEQLKLTEKHQIETDRINKLESISNQAKADLVSARQPDQPDPTQDEIDIKTQELLEIKHQEERERLNTAHQQQLIGVVEEHELADITAEHRGEQADLEAQQQDEITIVRAKDRYKREIILISRRQEERRDLNHQQALEELSLKHKQEKEILIQKQRQRDQLMRYHIQLRVSENDGLEDQKLKMLTGLYERNDSTFYQEWDNLIAIQEQKINNLIEKQLKQKKALRRKNEAYEAIFENIENNDLNRSLIACTKAIRGSMKGMVNTPDAKYHLTTIVKTLSVKRILGIVEGYNLALAILHRKTNWSEVVNQLRVPNFPVEYDESLRNLGKKELKAQIKQKAFEALKVSADRGLVPAMSLLALVYNKSNYRWPITRFFTLGIARNKELLGQVLPNPARAAEFDRIAGFLGGDPAALLGLASLSARGLSGVKVAIRDERLLAEYQYILAAWALTDDKQLYLKRLADGKATRYTAYVKTFQGFQELADLITKVAKTANDLNTIASAFSGMPTSILRGAHGGTTTAITTTVAPTGITTATTSTR